LSVLYQIHNITHVLLFAACPEPGHLLRTLKTDDLHEQCPPCTDVHIQHVTSNTKVTDIFDRCSQRW